MTKKYVLAGALAAFLATANLVHAPVVSGIYFQPPKKRIIISESFLEKYVKENEERIKELIKEMDDIRNYRTSDFNKDSEELLLARMLLGETEDCPKLEKIAVAYTAINRAKRNNETLKEAILKPYQYSCFNPKLNSNKFLKDPLKYNPEEFLICLQLSKEILAKKYKDPTHGATHYYNPGRVRKPFWAKQLKSIGRVGKSYHVFYKKR